MIEGLNGFVIPPAFSNTTDTPPVPFCLHSASNVVNGDHEGFMIFGTLQSITNLCNSKDTAGDGTFKVVPHPFYQLWTLMFFWRNRRGNRKAFVGLHV